MQKGSPLASLRLSAKLTYSLFLLFIALGMWTSWDIYAERIGGSLESSPGQPSVAERYVSPPPPPAPSSDGPALDLPDEDPAPAQDVQDLRGPWILDVFHQHLFSVSVVFLILAHLFILAPLREGVRATVVAAAGASALLHVLAPVLIHRTGGLLWMMPVSGAAMGVTWTLMIVVTFGAMWLGGRRPRTT